MCIGLAFEGGVAVRTCTFELGGWHSWPVCVCAHAQSCVIVSCLLMSLQPHADTSCVYMRRIKDLTPPEEEGQRPPCVDMRVKVGCAAPRVCLRNSACKGSLMRNKPQVAVVLFDPI